MTKQDPIPARLPVLDQGGKSLAKSAWTGEQIDNAESG